ncbi:TonB-dependent receptor domain-containing protein [Ectothiorhodospira variabilis]|nr:TonB-dependent receptor [Ectothiorhodospira variabilis]MCG5497197.1 TonB-dependent receptor [Ectothiorhodospira variabilis]
MQTRSFLPAAVLLAIPSLATAQEQVAQLDPILVTPTRTAQTTDQTLASVTVIEREEIERLQPKEFVDLLRGRAGIGLTQNGPFGKTTSLFMRGTNSDHTLLLVDGVRMGSATTGQAAWQYLPPAEIERVEIVRGPRTSLYGSDAIGGVIQVFTKEGDGPAKLRAHLGAGSFNTREMGAGLSGSTGSTRYNLSVSHLSTDGINVQDETADDRRDGYENSSVSARLSHELKNGFEIFGSLLHAEGESDFDSGGSGDRQEFRQHASQFGVRGQLADIWYSTFSVAHSRDELETFSDWPSKFETSRNLFNWQNDVALAERHMLTLGMDYQNDRVNVSSDYSETRRDNVGLYAQWQVELGRYDLAWSLRHDDNETFGHETTGQIAWGMQLQEQWSLRASYGTAFKAPTFNELYNPMLSWDPPFEPYGNPDLDAEKSESLEVGLNYASGLFFGDLAIFYTEVENLISGWPAQNTDEARIRGMELEFGILQEDWSALAALTHLDHEDRETGNRLQRRPETTARVDLDRFWGDFTLGATVAAEGSRYNDPLNNERLGGFALLDLRASYRITPEWRLSGKIQNALDKHYETVKGYNQPGRAFFVTLNYQQQ